MDKIRIIINELTLEEKAGLCSGKDFWNLKGVKRLNIPSIMVTDGPHGLRKQDGSNDHLGIEHSVPATCFPTASSLASSWDKDLLNKVGSALGDECLTEEVSVLLGPGINIKRSPLCGRNFEYFSEDPYLSGMLASSFINGVQSKGIGTSLKHYVANNQEHYRMTIDTIVDERALREIYLTGFEIAVKNSQPWTVMCAYNKVNGTFMSEDNYLLNDVLKKEWGHNGIVVTDWGACNERVEGIRTGLELEMPSSNGLNDKKIVAAVKNGQLDESILDDRVRRILELIFKSEETLKKDKFIYNKEEHHKLARYVSSESMVLLKNEGLLPLKNNQKIGVIGEFAVKPRFQGGGSSHIHTTFIDESLKEITKYAGDDVLYANGYDVKTGETDETLLKEAKDVASKSDVLVLFIGLPESYESEGFDRTHLELPDGHNLLVDELYKVNKNIVVCLMNGAPILMPWLDKVNAVVEGYLTGQAGGGAFADVLFGYTNPSGKLAETFPLKLSDNSSYNNFPSGPKTVEYRESIYVGYRYYDAVKQNTLFPFGYGLSYTTFEYSNLEMSSNEINDSDKLDVSIKVKNSGNVFGKEIVQLYVRDTESSIFRPIKELKGFEKISLEPNEEKTVTFTLDKRSFAYYNVELKDWIVETGDFEVLVGASSQDIRLRSTVRVNSTDNFDEEKNNLKDKLPSYYNLDIHNINIDEFSILYGKDIPSNEVDPNESLTLQSTLGDIRRHPLGNMIYKIIIKMSQKQFGDKDEEVNDAHVKMIENMTSQMPLRALITFGGGKVTEEMMLSLLEMFNGKNMKGFVNLIRSIIER